MENKYNITDLDASRYLNWVIWNSNVFHRQPSMLRLYHEYVLNDDSSCLKSSREWNWFKEDGVTYHDDAIAIGKVMMIEELRKCMTMTEEAQERLDVFTSTYHITTLAQTKK
jgi:hypothetical protein